MKKTFYEKVGRKYVPVSISDNELSNSWPIGTHFVNVRTNGKIYRYNINPAYAPMIAAGIIAEDSIAKAIVDYSDVRPRKKSLTEEQLEAWNNLEKAFGNETHLLEWPSAREAAEGAVKVMMEEAEKLLLNPAVKKAYDHFLLVCELTKDTTHD